MTIETNTDDTRTIAGTCHFCITGEGLTRIVRDTYLSERGDSAFRILTVGLQGIGAEMVADILEGRSKLTGDETAGVDVVPDEDPKTEKYRTDIRYIYAGRVRIGKGWYRPVAKVTSFSARDAMGAAVDVRMSPDDNDMEGSQRALNNFARRRMAFYAYEGEKVVHCGKAHGFVIFEPVEGLPVWKDGPKTATEALAEAIAAGRTLEERGAARDEEWESREPAPTKRATPAPPSEEDIAARRAAEEAADAKREAEYLASVARIRDAVIEQAAGDFIDITNEETGEVVVRVPRAPFECWCLHKTPMYTEMPAWRPVAPQGMKTLADDPYHTDWFVGAGLDPRTAYNRDDGSIEEKVMCAALDTMREIQRRCGGFEVAVLVPGPYVCGAVGDEIAVIPNLSPRYAEAVMHAKAVITEEGGALAHCAILAMDRGVPVVRMPGAVAKFQRRGLIPAVLIVDTEKGQVRAG